ncbi:MAG: c-type cytochrome [Cardiobacteriaceae bacterium]|nr:c-type cytochrome [Cardiobacteriaceae bacterium]
MAANTHIPGYAKTIMVVAAVFMPVFLVLPFFFWGNEDNRINLAEQELQAGRLAPIGKLNIASADAAATTGAAAAAFDPETTYNTVCAACHATGVLNAPKWGEAAPWQAKIDERGGIDALIKQGIQGLNAMPPKGGAAVSDEDFGKVVKYMLQNANINVE